MNSNPLVTSVVMVAVFILGLVIGHYAFPSAAPITVGGVSQTTKGSPEAAAPATSGATTSTDAPASGTTVNTSSLSPSQKAMLKALGIDAETIVVTPTMIACAEAAVGVSRAEEIKNGATPSFSEGVKLVACYK